MHEHSDSVAALGEAQTLARILAALASTTPPMIADSGVIVGTGDDCAVLSSNGKTVLSTDTMIEGPDFRLNWHSGFELGKKLAATNLADAAAMGATPTGLTIAIACPTHTSVAFLEELARGVHAACTALAPTCSVIGGDLGTAPVLMLSATVIGQMNDSEPVLRSGAKDGDLVAYAGSLGLAAKGLKLLFALDDGTTPNSDLVTLKTAHPAAISAQLTPEPPIHSGRAAVLAGATAMMDVSDGLVLDASRIAKASSASIHLHREQLIKHFENQHDEHVALEHILWGGEDHGLLATFPAHANLPSCFIVIGSVSARYPADTLASSTLPEIASPVLLDGTAISTSGWDPFRNNSHS